VDEDDEEDMEGWEEYDSDEDDPWIDNEEVDDDDEVQGWDAREFTKRTGMQINQAPKEEVEKAQKAVSGRSNPSLVVMVVEKVVALESKKGFLVTGSLFSVWYVYLCGGRQIQCFGMMPTR